MTIDAVASEPQYRAHMQPVWEALAPALKGTFHTRPAHLKPGGPVLVASYVDARRAGNRPVIYMEHGAGQTYSGGTSYAGGPGKGNVALFLNPSERVAELNRKRYPLAEQAVIGCPLLDRWVGYRPQNPEPVIAFAWHRDGELPEARSAFRHYAKTLPALPYKLLGTGHPRAMPKLAAFYESNGIEWTADFAEVLARADLLVFDNTSAGFMFAALDRPVVVLDAPWYKRAWGGRFWEWADAGVRASEPGQLAGAIAEALRDGPEQAQRRREITAEIYGTVDGNAAQRAAFVVELWALPKLQLVAA